MGNQNGSNQQCSAEQAKDVNTRTIEELVEENSRLKRTLEEERKMIDPDLQEFLRLYQELPKFKGKLEEMKKNAGSTNVYELEIEELKQENVKLYTELKNFDPSKQIGVEKSAKLKDFEKELRAKKVKIEAKVGEKLKTIEREMDVATTKFAEIMESAVFEMSTTLNTCKEQLTLIEEVLEKNNGTTLIYEEIKKILLQQKRFFLKEIVASNLDRDPSNGNPPITPKDQSSNANASKAGPEQTDQNKIVIFYAPEDADDKTKAQSILRRLTQLNLDGIDVYRLGKIGNKPRPMVVTLENATYTNEILQNRFSLKDTEFKGIKIVKYQKDYVNKRGADENPKNAEADKTNPLCSSGSEETDDEDKPYKVVMFYVAEGEDDYERVMGILKELTRLPLVNVGFKRIGQKSDVKIRPLVVSFDSQKYVSDALKNRYSLKDTPFKGTKVVKYNKPTQPKDELFPF